MAAICAGADILKTAIVRQTGFSTGTATRCLQSLVATGATSIDAGAFALYCETTAVFIQLVKDGQAVNAAYRSELRKQMELLSIAGAKSRLAKMGQDKATITNPFTVRE